MTIAVEAEDCTFFAAHIPRLFLFAFINYPVIYRSEN